MPVSLVVYLTCFNRILNPIQSYTDYTPSQNIFQTVFGEIYNEGKN